MKNYISIGLIICVGVIAFLVYRGSVENNIPEGVACTMEAKLCPDGSYVGRQGPNCEFAECPLGNSSQVGDITLSVGETKKVGDVSVTFNKFLNDYRCPIDVQCIQAGAIVVNVTMKDSVHTETRNFPSDEVPYPFGTHRISIIDIAPAAHSKKEIKESEYRITFHIE